MIHAPSFPLQLDDTHGYANVTGLKELSRFHLTNLILTNPGEKISDSTYGVGIRQYLFENASADVFEDIRFRINSQVNSKLGYINLLNVAIGMLDRYDNIMKIRITYSVQGANLQDVLDLNINTSTGTAIFADNNY
jgi:hypothetical protein